MKWFLFREPIRFFGVSIFFQSVKYVSEKPYHRDQEALQKVIKSHDPEAAKQKSNYNGFNFGPKSHGIRGEQKATEAGRWKSSDFRRASSDMSVLCFF